MIARLYRIWDTWIADDADLVRTRDPKKRQSTRLLASRNDISKTPKADQSVETLDIVVDVGGVYSPEAHRYDHHQRGFSEVFGSGGFDNIKLSSAGLVYK